jgi:hypothetical protein
MRRQHNFPCRYPSHLGFANEAQFLKFARPRDQDNVTNLVRSIPNVPAAGTLEELSETTGVTGRPGKAKGVSA